MKKIYIILTLLLISVSAFAVEPETPAIPAVGTPAADPVKISCDSYETCLEQFASLSAEARKNFTLLYYNNSNTEYKFNIFGSYMLKIGANSCPPVVDVYRRVNNMNLALDLFSIGDTGECQTFYGNVNGDGLNRDSIIGQIEVKYCNKSGANLCDQGLILNRLNLFK